MKEKKQQKKALSHQFLNQSVMLSFSTDICLSLSIFVKKRSISTLGGLMIPLHYFASLMFIFHIKFPAVLGVQAIHRKTKSCDIITRSNAIF